jgi:hypothetical protein
MARIDGLKKNTGTRGIDAEKIERCFRQEKQVEKSKEYHDSF